MALVVAPPVKPMLAKVKDEIPQGEGWIYEPKWDGFRTIVFREGDELWLRSRNDRPMNRYFPEVVELLLGGLPDRCVVDGEIILPTAKGLDFDALQLRLHPAASRNARLAAETPCSFVAFDLLAEGDTDFQPASLLERQAKLDAVLKAATPSEAGEPATRVGPCLYLTPRTTDADEAQVWFVELEKLHLDGIIAKRTELPYSPGDRVMIKIKHRRTADCVVVGYRSHKHGGVGSLLLGLYDGGELRYIGHTSAFNAADRKKLLAQLEPLENESPFQDEWGPGGQSRWSTGREADWHSIEPVLVVEVSYDYMQAGQRFRHAAGLVRWRDDKKPEDCTFDQVRY